MPACPDLRVVRLQLTMLCLIAGTVVGATVFKPGKAMYDVTGKQIDAHGGGFLMHNGTTFWYGSARLNYPDNGTACTGSAVPPRPCDKGINLYSSTDLYNWKFESLVVNALATSDNGFDLERPKVLACGGRYVMWLRGTPIYNGTQLKVGVLVADSPRGPWQWVGDRNDPFHLVGDKYQYGDATLWGDPTTGRNFVYWRARTHEAGFRGMELNDDCTGVKAETDTQIFHSPNREAPAFFAHGGSFYLWASGTLGWTPVQGYVYRGASALGPFNSSTGHGWHAYTKPSNFNTTHTFAVRDGYLPVGHDWIDSTVTTFSHASTLCASAAECLGFTFKAFDRQPPENETLKVSFKTDSRVVPEGDPEGLQPPPIPEPGSVGNRKEDGQPGLFSYGSQSTFILPNPAWQHGSSKLPQFVYIADRWQPDTPNFGLYVWLPLFVDPRNPARVSVVWNEEWQLDNVTSPFDDSN